jgi:hypothetical protein
MEMFATPQSLKRRTGRFGVNRYEYLKQLIYEYETTEVADCKEQILANLANFAYDPINYEYFRRLNVIDIFLNVINKSSVGNNHVQTEHESKLVYFAVSGICNLCNDDKNSQCLLNSGNNLIGNLLSLLLVDKAALNLVLNIFIILIFLNNDRVKDQIVQSFKKNSDEWRLFIDGLYQSNDKRLSNIVQVFIEDFQIKF